ncbi:hypothetical protein FAS41_30080 [Pseudomonas nicosulfuronedens]|uniref:Uncharacterized protein n=1 Tax=Pseudomonas nicosulfuronedens TaxID=2571105 RepID=A0A5R9QL27_9PSED|nr:MULTISPECIES: hypothetical protein [Pseudomonas]TLX69780.1 hypothetical protein FAS41_30080 [Pseudomonas nicosulfuronedens]
MGAAAISLNTRRYQLPPSALNPFALPGIAQAMRVAQNEQFALSNASCVDFKGHSALCTQALDSGLIGPEALEWLEHYPNAYGLHRLTGEVVAGIERVLALPTKGLFKDKAALLKSLTTPYADPCVAAGATLHCIDASLIQIDAVAELIEQGPDCASALFDKIGAALDGVLTLPEPAESSIERGIQGEHYVLEGGCFSEFFLELPEVDDFHEVRVILFKTLDAMTHYLIPFNTPATFLGEGSYYNHEVAGAYASLKQMVSAATVEQMTEYLLTTPDEQLGFDTWSFTGDEGFDEESAERFAAMLVEMHELTELSGFYLGADKPQEMRTLRRQALEAMKAGNPYSDTLMVLVEALELCLSKAEQGYCFDHDLHSMAGTASDGMTFFESIVVQVSGDFPNLLDSTYEGYDGQVHGCGYPAIGLPLKGPEMASQTLPILRDTASCIQLLGKICESLGTPNDQQ